MMRLRPWTSAVVVLLAVSAAAGWMLLRDRRVAGEQTERLLKLESENRDLRARGETLAREVEAARQGVPAPDPQPARPAGAEPPRRGDPGVSLEQTRLLIQFRDRLEAANRSIAQMQARIDELQAAVDRAAEENQRLAASELDLKAKLAGTSRVLEAVQAELKTKEARLAQLETANASLREENRLSAARVAQLTPVLRDLEELDRRREAYLANILRRYKDVTEQYRAIGGRLDASQEGTAELARIRESIAQAEEDLRQLSGLNAQASRLQRRLTAR